MLRSLNRGDAWQEISPDLTTNDPVKLKGNIQFCTLTSIAESPLEAGLIWVGTDDGKVQVTRNGGGTWANVRPNIKGVPPGIWCSRVEASHFDEGTCYVTFDGHRSNDFGTYVYASTDFGSTWRSIASDLPKGEVVRTLTEDLKDPDVLYVGTDDAAGAGTSSARPDRQSKARRVAA